LWSPNYRFDDAEYDQTAESFDNPDFDQVSIHSYRHRYGAAQGDPAFEYIPVELARQPVITVPTIVLHGEIDGVSSPQSSERHDRFFCRPASATPRADCGSLPAARDARRGGESGSRAWLAPIAEQPLALPPSQPS
jgi:pimeloyl-ACP methyl ester carboxylesterase